MFGLRNKKNNFQIGTLIWRPDAPSAFLKVGIGSKPRGRLAPVLKTIFFINVSYHILVASLTLMALFKDLKQSHQSKTSYNMI